MTRRAIRNWYLLHKWTSLVCTAFLLLLCLTGLPLIFHHEIDDWTGSYASAPAPIAAASGEMRTLDEIMALAIQPGEVGLFLSFDEDRPVVNVTTGPTPDAATARMTFRSFDLRTGRVVGARAEGEGGVMDVLLQLHTDLFLGLAGELFLGLMGVMFVAALVSGVVLYAPFMRKLEFGTVRVSRSRRVRWLDLHNLIGIVALAWMAVVGLTGVINTLATPIMDRWRTTELADMTAAYAGRGATAPEHLTSLHHAVATAMAAAPGTRPQFVAFPGGDFSSRHHYAIYLQGATPLTKRLLTPALVDAETGALTAVRPMPWYVQALFLSQPLHFGDYGGLPLKLLWAALDLFTIAVLGSGLYLWLGRRRAPLDARVREVETGGLSTPVAAE